MPSSPSLPIFSDPKPFGSMHAVQNSETRSQKRQRCAGNCLSDPPTPVGQHCAKQPRVLSSNPPGCSWDRLSKVWLTRRALEELNRRTAEHTPPAAPSEHDQLEGSLNIKEDWRRLKRFARHGGPDLRNLRGYPAPTYLYQVAPNMTSSRSRSSSRRSRSNLPNRSRFNATRQSTRRTSTTTERKSSAYDANFEQVLVDHGAHPVGYDYPDDHSPLPNNLDEILQRISRPRPSLSPSRFSETDFRKFERANERALGEKKVMSSVFPIIRGNADIPYEEDKLFGNLERFADGIVNAMPDFYDGAHAAQLDHRVRSELNSYIVPSTQHNAPILPNFFAEVKGPDGSAAVAKRQALYDGTLGARAMLRLQTYGKELAYDGNAYVVTSTYYDGTLKLFTTHPTASNDPGRDTDYHMTQLRSFALTDTAETFRQGASAFRNARDWAKEQRDYSIANANGTVADIRVDMSFETSSQSLVSHSAHATRDSETSADEIASANVTRMGRSVGKRTLSPSRRREDPESRDRSSRRSRVHRA
ncbi:conserved hypothetical protein [Histoplasma capsulatum var. duboisii H88]|uniref:DUF7924 domain-containing protein n=1 Tax=Ajellomyces capsulatus (strain H88) TaxID=544711 RepID=F0UG11_AJEC8|nr:conserved hypothetical protein [Histoplasma capsulatum var. duboisii H88]QSS54997.1 hypothetical protein I7I53_02746 [Histoplasma capsulatum var. duboisii H88]